MEVFYTLQDKTVLYAKDGDEVVAEFVQLNAPSSKQLKHTTFLKQSFFRALNSLQGSAEQKKGEDSPDMKAEDVISMLYMSDVDMNGVLLSAIELFNSGVALVDGEQRFTKPIIDTLSPDDLELMTGTYLVNFILASALAKAKKA